MTDVTAEYVIGLAVRLAPEDRLKVIREVQNTLPPGLSAHMTLDDIEIKRARRLAAGEFQETVSLLGKYARPDLDVDLSLEAINATIREFTTEWEQEKI